MIRSPSTPAPIVRLSVRTISTSGGTAAVTGYDNTPAAGRAIILLGKDQWGAYVVKGSAQTDASGEYSISVSAGPNDRFVVVGVGDPAHSEHTRALGDLLGV